MQHDLHGIIAQSESSSLRALRDSVILQRAICSYFGNTSKSHLSEELVLGALQHLQNSPDRICTLLYGRLLGHLPWQTDSLHVKTLLDSPSTSWLCTLRFCSTSAGAFASLLAVLSSLMVPHGRLPMSMPSGASPDLKPALFLASFFDSTVLALPWLLCHLCDAC